MGTCALSIVELVFYPGVLPCTKRRSGNPIISNFWGARRQARSRSAPLAVSQSQSSFFGKTHRFPKNSGCVTPVARMLLTRLGFEKIFKTQGIFKIRRSVLLVILVQNIASILN